MDLSYYKTIDDFLGKRDGRYFGEGYLNTKRSLSDFVLRATTEGFEFTCAGILNAPGIWSLKGERQQKIHLSSIDAIEFAVECSRNFFDRLASGNELSIGSIKKIVILAGKAPIEEELSSIKIRGQFTSCAEDGAVLRMNIANMQADVTFSTEKLTNPIATGDQVQPVSVDNVMINRERLIASAIVSSTRQHRDDGWPLSNCFAAMAQLGQTLLYQLDNISRQDSDTLWMRKISIVLARGVPLWNTPQPIYVGLDNVKKLKISNAEWRCADVFSIIGNTNIVCKVAHKIL